MQALEQEIKALIISSLALDGVAPDDIDSTAPLFGDGLGLDSIDALELGLALKNRYRVNFSADPDESKLHFANVRALAQYIATHRKEAP
ncbi:MAG: phosphopantetheine-binding protein [Burkholderiaceae bacterium]|jgi:acyl carrier protein|nr:phosphopantetheine-binding protein [Burkholderiaceae bacterium]